MQLIEEGLELIKKFEGFSSKPYKCCAGFLTIGYGHKIRSNEKYERISEMEANQMLQKDLQSSMYSVMNNIDFMLNNYQFSALVSFTYNVGGAALQRSTLRQKINSGELEGIQHELLRWVYVKGYKIKGLVKRRLKEVELFYKY